MGYLQIIYMERIILKITWLYLGRVKGPTGNPRGRITDGYPYGTGRRAHG